MPTVQLVVSLDKRSNVLILWPKGVDDVKPQSIDELLILNSITTTQRERSWCLYVQRDQDSKVSWSDAVAAADTCYPLPSESMVR